jgi:hypothetical protein
MSDDLGKVKTWKRMTPAISAVCFVSAAGATWWLVPNSIAYWVAATSTLPTGYHAAQGFFNMIMKNE